MRRLLSLILMLGASTSLFAQTYCTPAYSTGCSLGDQIESFSTTLGLTNITNLNTGCSPAYYTYYNTLTASQVQGGSIDFTVVAGSAYTQGFAIYIDWNNDGDFDDVGEDVWNSGSAVASATGSIAIPLTATPGLKRMRVRSNWNALPLGPCVSQSYGEAEDYNLDVISLGPCTAPPTAGFAVASDSSICVNNTIFLSLNGFSVGSGQTYQWQSSLDGVTFTDMVGDTLSYATATISDTLWFQCIVTCSGQSATSSVVNVFSIGNPLSGTYTVNPALPSVGTNFASFGDLATALECGGLAGPVTVNVTGGVYNEQFTLTGWTGASSVNTVTIQPDPASSAPVEVVWAPTGSTDNYVIEFVDVEHLTMNGLNFIDTANPAYSQIFYFTGTCSNLSFDGNSFQGSAATSNSTNTSLIYESADEINNLSFTNNTFNGGSYATYLSMGTTLLSDTIIFNNNSINTLAYGLYTGYWTYVEALDNDIVLTGGTSNYAIRVYGFSSGTAPVNTRVRIEGNSIQMNGSSTLYGIYIYYMNSLSNDPSTVINNMVYCSPTSSSTNYGIYSYHLANTNIYHNSFDIEAGNTSARCAYFSGSTSTSYFVPGNVDVRNNIFVNYGAGQLIYVTGVADDGGYFGNINSNLYYANGANWFYYGANVADLTAWQTATGYDAASITGDPIFVGGGDLHVLGGAPNDAGDNGVGVFSDIDGDTRPYPGSTIVDIGADEYEPVGCLPPVNAAISNVTANSADVSWQPGSPVQLLYEIQYGPTGFTPGSGTTDLAFGTSYSIINLAPQTTYDVYLTEICSFTDSSIQIGPYTFTTNCVPAIAPYSETFDDASWTPDDVNFSSVNDVFNPCWTSNPSGTTYSWHVRSTPTGSSSTGPSADNSGSGNYIYVEASNGLTGDIAEVTSPLIDISALTTPELVFHYHAYGINIDSLFVEIDAGSGWIGLDTLVGAVQTSESDPFIPHTVGLAGYSGTIQLRWRARSGGCCSGDLAIDDVTVDNAPACPNPSFITALNATASSIDLGWTNGSAGATNWVIEYGTPGFTLGTGTVVSATTNPFTIPGLQPNTTYEFYVAEVCPGGADSSNFAGPATSITGQIPVTTFPYLQDWENGPGGWTIANGSATNQWVIGSATSNGSGTQALYISNDNGVSNAYTITSTSIVHAYRDFQLPSGNAVIDLSFDWQALAESCCDYLKVWVVPTNFVPTPGALITATGTAPTGRIQLGGNFNQSATWNSELFTLPTAYDGQSFRLVLEWRNDGSVGTMPSGAFDNIAINLSNCPAPFNVAVTPSNLSADVTWTPAGAATTFNIEWGAPGFALGSGTSAVATTPNYTIPGLTAGTTYEVYIQSDCGADSSSWTGPVAFTTALCDTTNQCVYTVDLYDTYGDGWNGNDFGFVQNGVVVSSFTLASGDSLIGLQVPLCDGIPAELQLLASGSFQYEIYMNIYDPSGALVFALPSGGSFTLNDSIFGTTPNCGTLVSQACDDFEGYTPGDLVSQSSYWESWDGGAQDAAVVASPTHGGNAALQIHTTGTNGFTDILFNPASQSSGVHELSFWFNIPAANGGYFSLMHDYVVGGPNTWAAEVLLDGTNGQGSIEYGSSAGGNIANFNFNPGAWNEVRVIIDLDQDQAQMILNGLSVANWVWSDGQSGVYGNFSAVNLYSFAPGALTPLMYVDDFCFGDYVPVCNIATVPAGVDVDGCDGQPVTLSATPGDTNTYVVWLDALNTIAGSGDNFTIDSLIANTTLQAIDASPSAPAEHVGPLPSIAANGFGNFTNGIYATAISAFRLDSILLKSDGALDVRVNVWTDQPSAGGVVLQQSELISLPAAGEHQVAVDLTVQPGNYFFNIDYVSGAGQLFRADGGASFPYVFTDVVSLDSINFANQLRYYYLFDWVVTPVCLGTQATAITANLNPAPAASFTSSSVPGCTWDFDASASSGDTYTWDFGDGASGTGATTSHTYSADGSYSVALTVTNNCGSDTYTETLVVDCSSLSEQALQQLRAFPNPTTGELFVELQTLREEHIVVKITNPAGQNILTQAFDQPAGVFNQRFDLSDLAKGVYFLHVEANNQAKVLRITLQ